MRKNSVKNTRINAEVQRELSRIISREIKDPRINPMTSVVEAVVTPDLKYLQGIHQCPWRSGFRKLHTGGTEQCNGIYQKRTCTFH